MIRIMFIIPYEEMEADIASILQEFPCEERIEYQCALYTYVDLEDYRQEWPCDVIVARGHSADVLGEQKLGVPVIKVNFTSTDALNAVQVCRKRFHSQRIAIIGEPILAVASEIIQELSDVPIDIYTIGPDTDNQDLIRAAVDTAIASGHDTIIGGGTAYQYSDSLHLNAYNVQTNPETLYYAISEAVYTVQLQRQERIRTKTLQTVMDTSGEGFILTSPAGTIQVCNQFLAKIFHMSPEQIAGRSFHQFLPELADCFTGAVKTRSQAANEIIRRDGKIYTVRVVPVIIGDTVDSVFISCHDISSIQEMEHQIRTKLSAKGMATRYSFSDIIYQSEQMERMIKSAKEFAAVDSNVLIFGETGTGKELVAQSIHAISHRANQPFVAVNCAAIPEQLLESEMFGYTGGAFTGAAKEGKRGLFELAHNGTLFLDEISELPYSFQGKLLRALQEHEIRRIGDDRVIPINVRIIAATNQDLETMIRSKQFRRDLYFRLNVLCLFIPPLCQRTEDIVPLFQSFLHDYASRFGKEVPVLSDSAQTLLNRHEWIGNIRELRNVAERFMVLYKTGRDVTALLSDSISPAHYLEYKSPLEEEGSEAERIRKALKEAGNRTAAAALLGMSRSTLWRKMRQYGIDK